MILFFFFRAALWNLWELVRVVFKYYRDVKFFYRDLHLFGQYIGHSPYKLSKRFWKYNLYGETPLTTLDKIAMRCGINSHDVIYDLGAGRGRSLLFLSHFIKAECVGIELNPHFVKKGQSTISKMGLPNMHFVEGSYFDTNFERATVIYLYGSTLQDDEIVQLVDALKSAKRGTKIITVSFSLSEYCKEPLFQHKECFKGAFPWGKADVYFQLRL